MALERISDMQVLEQVIATSNEKPLLILKHSTTCPISARAYQVVEEWSQQHDVAAYLVYVIEDRSISNEISARFAIKHESPQVLLIQNEQVHYHTSHFGIKKNNLLAAFGEL
jgi:bacillithiol system protein YtxJ